MSDYHYYVYGFATKLVIIMSKVEHLAMAMEEYLEQINADPSFVVFTFPWSMFEYMENLGNIRKDRPIEVYHTCSKTDAIEKMKKLKGYTITYKNLVDKLPSTNPV